MPSILHRLAGWALLAAATAARRLPASLAYGVAELAAPVVVAATLLHEWRVGPRGRGMLRNQRIVFRERLARSGSRWLLFAWARHVTQLAVDFCRMPRIDAATLERHVEIGAIDELRPLIDAGRGLICVSAHAGVWELCGHAASVMGIPVTIVARPLAIGPVDDVVRAIRCSGGQRVLSKWGAVWRLKKSLERGEVVGLLADEDERTRPIFAPFLGTLAATTPVPAFLQRLTGAPIAVVSCHRVARGRFRFHVWRVIRAASPGGAEPDLQRTTEQINEALSRAILRHPEQWLWGSRRFRTRPPGERAGADGLPPTAAGSQPHGARSSRAPASATPHG